MPHQVFRIRITVLRAFEHNFVCDDIFHLKRFNFTPVYNLSGLKKEKPNFHFFLGPQLRKKYCIFYKPYTTKKHIPQLTYNCRLEVFIKFYFQNATQKKQY